MSLREYRLNQKQKRREAAAYDAAKRKVMAEFMAGAALQEMTETRQGTWTVRGVQLEVRKFTVNHLVQCGYDAPTSWICETAAHEIARAILANDCARVRQRNAFGGVISSVDVFLGVPK